MTSTARIGRDVVGASRQCPQIQACRRARYDRSVPGNVLVELDARVGGFLQEVLEPAPALLQGLDAQVDAAKLQEIEGVEEHPLVVSLTMELFEVCCTVGIATDRLAVERPRRQAAGSPPPHE